jgi:hypothetical protein
MSYAGPGHFLVHNFDGGRGYLGSPQGQEITIHPVMGVPVGHLDRGVAHRYVATTELPSELLLLEDFVASGNSINGRSVLATPVRDTGVIRGLVHGAIRQLYPDAGIKTDDSYEDVLAKMREIAPTPDGDIETHRF